MLNGQKQTSLAGMLCCLTLIVIVGQVAFFFTHYQMGHIADTLANASIKYELFYPVILLPILGFIFIQLVAYGLYITWIWFLAVSLGELIRLSPKSIYRLGILFWCLGCLLIFSFNTLQYPHSFFAEPLHLYPILNRSILSVTSGVLLAAMVFAYVNCFWFKRHYVLGVVFALFVVGACGSGLYAPVTKNSVDMQQPNVILIGLDSLRPDYTGYFGNQHVHTPHIDHFLHGATIFTNAYTPLARTFPSWASILTAKYPLHSHARVNLANPANIVANDTLAKRLKENGYFTIYGTDEPRFTDITQAYGFDRIIGPKGGAVEFLLSGLSDLPLTNLLINLPAGRFLFPYNYGNRSADITYQPDNFLKLVKYGIANRPNKPVLLAIHLCLTHWPFRWAQDGQSDEMPAPDRYRSSIKAVDAQLGSLLQILKAAGLLDHSIVVLLSDHGVTLGMPHDRLITEKKYHGDLKKLKSVSAVKLGSAPDFTLEIRRYYTISTSYGQGTDVLSPKQYHVLMAFKGFGVPFRPAKKMNVFSSLFDIAPTVLDYLHFSPMRHVDGMSLMKLKSRPFFIETGDKVAETETNKIYVDKVVKQTIGAYRIDRVSGLLILTPAAEKAIIDNKQHAIFSGDWLLAHYPSELHYRIKGKTFKPVRAPAYFVLVNLKTGQWTVGLTSQFAKTAPVSQLMRQFKAFYGDEV